MRTPLIKTLALSVPTLVSLYAVGLHILKVVFPWQIDTREGALLLQVVGQLQGVPVWEVDGLPRYFNVYGPLYTDIGALLGHVFGVSFFLLRMITLASIVASVLVMNTLLQRFDLSLAKRILLCLSFYLALLYSVTAHARPDALGVLIFTIGIFLMETRRLSTSMLASVILLSFAGFLAKPYFLILGPLASSYIFFYHSCKVGLFMAISFLAGFVSFLFLLDHLYPTFITSIFGPAGGFTEKQIGSFLHVSRQSSDFLLMNMGSLLLAAMAMNKKASASGIREERIKPSFSLYSVVIVALLLSFWLGHHTGNYLSYYNQLLLPLLLVAVGRYIAQCDSLFPSDDIRSRLVAAILLGFSAYYFLQSPIEYLQKHEGFERLDQLIAQHNNILAESVATGMLISHGKTVYESGQNEYFGNAANERAPKLPGLGLEKHKIKEINDAFDLDIDNKIRAQYFDLIVTYSHSPASWDKSLKNSCYQQYETIPLAPPMQGTVLLAWVPSADCRD